TPYWFPNRRTAMRQRVSNPDCAVDARPHSHREQHRLIAAPSVLAVTLDCALAGWQALSRQLRGLTVLRGNQMFQWFFVSLNGSVSGRFSGETNFRERKRCGSGRTMRGIGRI